MTHPTISLKSIQQRFQIAIAWCLAYNTDRTLTIEELRNHIYHHQPCSPNHQPIIEAAKLLISNNLQYPTSIAALQQLIQTHPLLWNNRIGIVYGGATKIKQYVFEATKLQEIRGASALLDTINLVDLPAFFHAETDPHDRYFPECKNAVTYCETIRNQWLASDPNFTELANALIPELIIYSTGGNILAFCPAAFIDPLANAIEKRYTHETQTANSCAVGATFKPLEIFLGLLPDKISDQTFWFETYKKSYQNPTTQNFISAYIPNEGNSSESAMLTAFQNRKSFNELTSKLAIQFNQRRSGNITTDRPSRRFPAFFETHPYLQRDSNDKRSAIVQAKLLPGEPWYSEATARKRLVGQIAKREDSSQNWYKLPWKPNSKIETWVSKFETFLNDNDRQNLKNQYLGNQSINQISEARSLQEIGNASRGFVAYIYADGNNMGGYIQKIKSPQAYQKFSQDIFTATEQSVYKALATHLQPHVLNGLTDSDNTQRNDQMIHPFEIITIGGDDVMLVVPADKALAIAKELGEAFEVYLSEIDEYQIQTQEDLSKVHRYSPMEATRSQSSLSMSTGVLITADTTPIYYAEDLTTQLLKSAKERSKTLKKVGYYGGTIDFLVLKSVTMISSNIKEFRKEALVKSTGNQKLQLYAAPYTLHEIGGLLEAGNALKTANFPRSQLYQIRSLLDRGKRTAILNYRYFRTRLKIGQATVRESFEEKWCIAHSNSGNIAPWMYDDGQRNPEKPEDPYYETIWRELVDLYDFMNPINDSSLEYSNLDETNLEVRL